MKKLTALFLIISLTLSLCACSLNPFEISTGEDDVYTEEEKTTAQAASQQTEYKPNAESSGTIGLAWVSASGLNPYQSTNVTNLAIESLMYESLFIVNSSYEIEAVLCKSCKPSGGYWSWYFELDPDAHFSDGTPVTSADVIASIDAARKSNQYNTRFRVVNSYRATDDYNFSISLNAACQYLPMILDSPIVKKDSIKEDVPIGSGPYYLSGNKLIQNEQWWQGRDPLLERDYVNLIEVETAKGVRDEFEFGDVDIVYSDAYMTNASAYHGDNEPWAVPTLEMQYIGFNTKSNYCQSNSLRAAITYLVDRSTIIAKLYSGAGQAATLPVNPNSAWYDTALASSYAYNPSAFDSAYATCGVIPDWGNPMKLLVCNSNPMRVAAAEYIAKELTDHGLPCEVVAEDRETFIYFLISDQFDLYMTEVKLSPLFDLAVFFGYNYYLSVGGLSDSTLQDLANSALADSTEYYNLCRTVLNRGLLCPIMFKTTTLYTTRGTISNVYPCVSCLLQSNGYRTWAEVFTPPES